MSYKKFLGAASAALMIVVVIVVLAPGAWAQSKFKTLYTFTGGKDGRQPQAGLIFDAVGNLYGTTNEGGDLSCYGGKGCGEAFELTPNPDGRWKEKPLHKFKGNAHRPWDGDLPVAGLIFDQAGNLYGTTEWGGPLGQGSVFKLTPNTDGGWTESLLYSFTQGADGSMPVAGLIFDQAGNLYGTAGVGGTADEYGSVFELTPNEDGSWTFSVLYTFTGGTDGGLPAAALIFDQAGNLYGTAAVGGDQQYCKEQYSSGCGVVFELTPNVDGSWTEKALHRFSGGRDGATPESTLIFDSSGNLYGTTLNGGANGYGNVFELTPNVDGSWKEKVLHQFTRGKDGAYSSAGLIFDAAKNLYGTTSQGGNLRYCEGTGCGVVFELTPNVDGSWTEKALHRFTNGRDGAYPAAGLIFDAAGNLYGTTAGDGVTTFGSVFEITP